MARRKTTREMTSPAYRWHKEHGMRLFDLADTPDDGLKADGWHSSKAAADDATASATKPAVSAEEKALRAEMFAKAKKIGLRIGGRISTAKLAEMMDKYDADMQPKTDDSA